jgi:archaellum component FlaF (FlaF/FlaG flagellin family)
MTNQPNTTTENTIHDQSDGADIAEMVTALYNKYTNLPNVQQKLIHHIMDALPTILENTVQQCKQREERKKSLEEKSDEFIEEFLAKTRYFYNSCTELFFIYSDDKTYEVIKEDNIQHSILTTITASHKDLLPWKYKIKIQIIKRIRENNNILKSIPESETIQNVIRFLTPALFYNKDTVKYFLTVVGDILHKKNSFHYFINSKTFIPFVKELNQECYKYYGINLLPHFKFKYYEHTNEDCRLVSVCELSNAYDDYFKSHIVPHIIDLFCVASHYSTRYVSADLFLEKYCNDYSVINHALYLKHNTNLEIVSRFINSTTEECPGYNITCKNMSYLWKIFIEEENIPNIFFNHSLQQLLSTNCEVLNLSIDALQLPDDVEKTVIKNRTSKHLPFVCSFMSFWNTYIIDFNNAEAEEEAEEEYELELDELLSLFNKSIKRSATTLLHNNVTDKMLLGLIKHFYPDIIIEDDKYLIHVGCRSNIWNKRGEIEEFIKKYKESKMEIANATSQSLYTIYQCYCKYAFDKEYNIISKRWFEKYFMSVYNSYLIDTEINANIIVSPKWLSI